jgi:serine/threonine protein kinase/tetratricopeptide (TPR) repeat protein
MAITKELWVEALFEYELLLSMSPAASAAHIEKLDHDRPELAQLVAKLRAKPELTLQPLEWSYVDSTPTQPPESNFDQQSGHRLGAYSLIREIGQGGIGRVWLAERADGRYRGEVAIKLLSSAALVAPRMRERFAREGELLAKLSHPNIARLLDAGLIESNTPYLVLEYVDGVPLHRYCEKHILSVNETIKLFCTALDAVAYAHSLLILHRDIKPSNILVNTVGEVKLLDFGLGKLLDENDVAEDINSSELTRVAGVGYTARYAPPEQIKGDAVSTASDVYSLGVTLYEILTGSVMEASENYTRPSERLAESATRSNWSKTVKGDIDSIIAKAVSVAPKDRYVNAQAMKEDLLRFLAHEPVTAQPDTNLYRTKKFVRRHKLAVGASALTLLTILVALSISVVQTIEAHKQRDAAQTEVARRVKSHAFMVRLVSEYATKEHPLSSVELLDIGVNSVESYFKDDYREIVATLFRLNGRYVELGEIDRERTTTFKALEYAKKSGDENLIAGANCMVAKVMANTDIASAMRHLSEAKIMFASARDPSVGIRGECWFNEISILISTGDYVKAISTSEEAIAFFRPRPDASSGVHLPSMLNVAGRGYTARQQFTDAERVLREVLELDERLGAKGSSSNWVSQANLLNVWLQAGDYARAQTYLQQVILPMVGGDRTKIPAGILLYWAAIAVNQGDYAQTRELLALSKPQSTKNTRMRYLQASIALQLCRSETQQDCVAFAYEHFAQVARENFAFNPRETARIDLAAGEIALTAQNFDQAMIHIDHGLTLSRRGDDDSLSVTATLLLRRAQTWLARSEREAALSDVQSAITLLSQYMQYSKTASARYAEALLTRAEVSNANGAVDSARLDVAEAERIFRAQMVMTHPIFERIKRLKNSLRIDS